MNRANPVISDVKLADVSSCFRSTCVLSASGQLLGLYGIRYGCESAGHIRTNCPACAVVPVAIARPIRGYHMVRCPQCGLQWWDFPPSTHVRFTGRSISVDRMGSKTTTMRSSGPWSTPGVADSADSEGAGLSHGRVLDSDAPGFSERCTLRRVDVRG